ncbi:MAG TPA: hypothetical protein ENI07_13540 [Desulfobacterales bacterium]|nr:hypothetical protein [Desulfobacterales bacterium]
MNDQDKKEFSGIMKALALDSGVEFTKDSLRLYFAALKTFTIKQVKDGVKKVLTTWEYNRFPPIAVLIKAINNEPAIEDKALSMAHYIVSHLKAHGATIRPDLSGDHTADWLMKFRWNYTSWASEVLESELKWWVKEFCEAYRAYTKTDVPVQIEASKEVKQLAENMFESV